MKLRVTTIVALTMGLALCTDGARAEMTITRASVSSAGVQADGGSGDQVLSSNGRYVAFESWATNLVAGDTNGDTDIFVRDLLQRSTERVSLNSAGEEADNYSAQPSISDAGRYVAFESNATNLVVGDTNNARDIFVRDRTAGTTELISVASDETKGDGVSHMPSISGDGNSVAFHSSSTNLHVDDSDTMHDIFVRDRSGGTTELISVSSTGTKGDGASEQPSISSDGRYVTFRSYATTLHVADSDTLSDIFVRDLSGGTTELVSVSSTGTKGNGYSDEPSISANGRYVAFDSTATNLVTSDTNAAKDIFVHDRQMQTTERVSVGNGGEQGDAWTYGYGGSLSADGRYVIFQSNATNLVAGDTNNYPDVFRRDRISPATLRVNLDSSGNQTVNGYFQGAPDISGDGMAMSFATGATTLVPGDTNNAYDIFVVAPAGSYSPFFWPIFLPSLIKGDK